MLRRARVLRTVSGMRHFSLFLAAALAFPAAAAAQSAQPGAEDPVQGPASEVEDDVVLNPIDPIGDDEDTGMGVDTGVDTGIEGTGDLEGADEVDDLGVGSGANPIGEVDPLGETNRVGDVNPVGEVDPIGDGLDPAEQADEADELTPLD